MENGRARVSSRRYDCFILWGSRRRKRPTTPMVKFRKSGFWKHTKQVHRHHKANMMMARRPHCVSRSPILEAIMLNLTLNAFSNSLTANFYFIVLDKNLSSKWMSSMSMMLMYAPKGFAMSWSFLSWFLISRIRSSLSSFIVLRRFLRNSLLL